MIENWESGERNMPQALWELMLFKLDGVQPAPIVWVYGDRGGAKLEDVELGIHGARFKTRR